MVLSEKVVAHLRSLYNKPNSPGSFSSPHSLYQAAKENNIRVKLKDVKDFLLQERTFTLHRPTRTRFKRNPIWAFGLFHTWFADLHDMQRLSRSNYNIHYLLGKEVR